MGLDAFFAVVTYTAAVIASLQAGSRAKYLLEHSEIGIKNGPLILPPKNENETSPLWDLVQVFQYSVRLGLSYDHQMNGNGDHEFVIQNSFEVSSEKSDYKYIVEPYSLSPFPRAPMTGEDQQLDKVIEMYIEDTGPSLTSTLSQDSKDEIQSDTKAPRWRLARTISWIWPSSYISSAKESTIYMANRVWHWRKSREEFMERYDDEGELDYSLCISKRIRLAGATGQFGDGANNAATQQVAQITSYAPKCFAKLRSHFKISEDAFRRSIFESGPYISFQSNSKGAARAGGVFFFTRDGAYMIKTIKRDEAKTLIRMLPKYYKHMKRNHRHSLLTRFCGMYTIALRDATSLSGFQDEEQYTFVIMNSVFPPKSSDFISEMYDLKGSTVGRKCSDEERQRTGRNAVLKDLDLAREVELVRSIQSSQKHREGDWTPSHGYGLSIGATAKSSLLAQLRKDVNLLQECNVMDYSLLVGVVDLQPQQQVDAADLNNMQLIENEKRLHSLNRSGGRPKEKLLTAIMTPVRALMAPPLFVSRTLWSLLDRTMTTVLTFPLPYYDSSTCGVDGGTLSILHGTKSGKRALYYMGVIDFLQPWTPRKVAERKLKGLLGYDTSAISCVEPDEYAARFLDFIDAHVS